MRFLGFLFIGTLVWVALVVPLHLLLAMIGFGEVANQGWHGIPAMIGGYYLAWKSVVDRSIWSAMISSIMCRIFAWGLGIILHFIAAYLAYAKWGVFVGLIALGFPILASLWAIYETLRVGSYVYAALCLVWCVYSGMFLFMFYFLPNDETEINEVVT